MALLCLQHISPKGQLNSISLYSSLDCSGQSGPLKIMHITTAYILHQDVLNRLSEPKEKSTELFSCDAVANGPKEA